jgi:hypothetical protein
VERDDFEWRAEPLSLSWLPERRRFPYVKICRHLPLGNLWSHRLILFHLIKKARDAERIIMLYTWRACERDHL